MNKKGIVGLSVLIVCIISLLISSRGIISDVDIQTSLSKISDVVDTHGKAIAEHTARIEKLETKPVGKTIGNQKTLPKLSTANVGSTTKNQVFHAEDGQVVYLNSEGTKFHFWDGCTWYGYGDESTKEAAVSGGAKECLLCQGHKVIKQK